MSTNKLYWSYVNCDHDFVAVLAAAGNAAMFCEKKFNG